MERDVEQEAGADRGQRELVAAQGSDVGVGQLDDHAGVGHVRHPHDRRAPRRGQFEQPGVLVEHEPPAAGIDGDADRVGVGEVERGAQIHPRLRRLWIVRRPAAGQ